MDLKRAMDGVSAGRRRALTGLVAGTVALVGGASRGEAKRKCKKKSCPTCPEPTVCPPPNTCPARVCCRCFNMALEPIACSYLPAGSTAADCTARCGSSRSGIDTPPPSGFTAVCDAATNGCVTASCPL